MIPRWAKALVLVAGLGLVIFAVAWPQPPRYDQRVYDALVKLDGQLMNTPLPELRLVDLHGRTIDWVDPDCKPSPTRYCLAGKVVFLNLWASYCIPCLEEMPAMVRLAQKMSREADDFVMLAVSWDEDPEDLGAFLARFPDIPRHMLIARDPEGALTRALGTRLLPETYIVDQDRVLVARVQNARDWDSDESVRLFTALIRRH